jgi:protein-tyrosine phosphatase
VKLLFVCLGNICRSPTAEAVMRELARREAPQLELEVDSAGTAAYHLGELPDARTRAAARGRGYDLDGHRARQVQRADFERFDLILAMDESNLEALQSRAPAGRERRLHLFLEFAPQGTLAEVPDPYYGGPEAFEEVLDLAELGCRGLIAHLQASGNRAPR